MKKKAGHGRHHPPPPASPASKKPKSQPLKRGAQKQRKNALRIPSLFEWGGGSETDTWKNHFQATVKSAESVVQATFSCKKLQRRGPRHRPADYSRPCSRTRLQGCRVVGFGVYGFRVLGFRVYGLGGYSLQLHRVRGYDYYC